MASQRTFVAFKPDAIRRRLVGRVLVRLEEEGTTVARMKTVTVTDELLESHYPAHVDEPYYPERKAYLQERPVIAAALEGERAVKRVRDRIGHTNPIEAEPGTIRGDLGTDSFADADGEGRAVRNLIHAAATVDEAEREIELWFETSRDHLF